MVTIQDFLNSSLEWRLSFIRTFNSTKNSFEPGLFCSIDESPFHPRGEGGETWTNELRPSNDGVPVDSNGSEGAKTKRPFTKKGGANWLMSLRQMA